MFLLTRRSSRSTLFPYTTLFRSRSGATQRGAGAADRPRDQERRGLRGGDEQRGDRRGRGAGPARALVRSEEHKSELQSLTNLVCRLLLEKKKKKLVFGM